jgi:hypothetical protein
MQKATLPLYVLTPVMFMLMDVPDMAAAFGSQALAESAAKRGSRCGCVAT